MQTNESLKTWTHVDDNDLTNALLMAQKTHIHVRSFWHEHALLLACEKRCYRRALISDALFSMSPPKIRTGPRTDPCGTPNEICKSRQSAIVEYAWRSNKLQTISQIELSNQRWVLVTSVAISIPTEKSLPVSESGECLCCKICLKVL